MNYANPQIADASDQLKQRFSELATKSDILKAVELKALFEQLRTLPAEQRASFGQELNSLRQDLEQMVAEHQDQGEELPAIDVTAPMDVNTSAPELLPSETGSQHPLSSELQEHVDIFARMGFVHMEAREIDDDYHMFSSLNFPKGHPARDDYDTFMTVQKDEHGQPLIAPAHVSTMQNRLQKKYRANLDKDEPIAVVYTGRTFRNEDIDARHEHTFYQLEISYIDKQVHTGQLIATIQAWLSTYYKQDMKVKIQPFYFPFTEPSFEFAASCIFCQGQGCRICSHTGWIELGGCGMIHPKVLEAGGIDPKIYTGFAGGFGIERLVMLKYGIEDIRYFESGRLDFLRQFA